MTKEYKYDVAISFAEEDRNAALALALAFEVAKLKAYYYPDNRASTLGYLTENLKNIYCNEAKYAVALVSEHYLSKNKIYVPIELEAIQTRMNTEKDIVYLVPVKMAETVDLEKQSVFKQQAYLQWNFNPKEIVRTIVELFGEKKEDVKLQNKSYLITNYVKHLHGNQYNNF